MTLVDDAIAQFQAELTPVASLPSGELGWGSDLSCTDDFAEGFPEVPADDVEGISQAIYRRLITPRGALLDDPEYGYHVAALLNAPLNQLAVEGIAGSIRNEVTKDDRVESVTVALEQVDRRTIRLTISVTPIDPALSAFELVISAGDGSLYREMS